MQIEMIAPAISGTVYIVQVMSIHVLRKAPNELHALGTSKNMPCNKHVSITGEIVLTKSYEKTVHAEQWQCRWLAAVAALETETNGCTFAQ